MIVIKVIMFTIVYNQTKIIIIVFSFLFSIPSPIK